MKKRVFAILPLLALMLCFAVTGVSAEGELHFERKSISLFVSQSYQLTALGETDIIVFTSSDDNVAMVDESGLVTALAAGKADITVTGVNGLYDTCSLTVLEGTAPTGVKLESQSVNIRVGEGYTLNASVRPKDAADKSLFFYSSDESVATVDENGYIKAIKPGVAVVTAESVSAAVSSRCMVKVTASDEQGSMDVNINGVLYSIAGKKMSDYIVEMKGRVTERTTTDSDGKFSLEDIPQGDYTLSVYRSSAPKKAVASAKLAVSSYNLNISCIINSKELVVLYQELAANNADLTDITLQQSAVVLDCGETYDMTFTTRPANAGTPVLSVHSSDEAIAAVDSDYRITGVSPGKATITFTTLDGKITKTCVVTVTRVNSNQYSGIIIGLEITIILLIVILFSISYKKYQREREQSEFLSEEDEEVLEELSED